jgi:hypothetical protein
VTSNPSAPFAEVKHVVNNYKTPIQSLELDISNSSNHVLPTLVNIVSESQDAKDVSTHQAVDPIWVIDPFAEDSPLHHPQLVKLHHPQLVKQLQEVVVVLAPARHVVIDDPILISKLELDSGNSIQYV